MPNRLYLNDEESIAKCRSQVSSMTGIPFKKFTRSDADYMLSYYEVSRLIHSGFTLERICEEMDISRNAVVNRRKYGARALARVVEPILMGSMRDNNMRAATEKIASIYDITTDESDRFLKNFISDYTHHAQTMIIVNGEE